MIKVIFDEMCEPPKSMEVKFVVGDIVRPSAKYIASGRAWEGAGKVDCVANSLRNGRPFVVVHFVILKDVEGSEFLREGRYCLDFCAVDEIELVPTDELDGVRLPDREPNLLLGFNLWPKGD